MPGPAPKDPRARRRRRTPGGGEWIDLHELEKPVLPTLPRRTKAEGPWSSRTRAMWNAWRKDPATAQYTPADISYAIETAYLVEQYQRGGKVTLASEIRLRMEGLGLNAKGRRNLRWRIAAPAEVVELHQAHAKPRRRLRAVAVDPGASR